MTDAKKIIILGTGGNCIDILDTIRELNAVLPSARYECIGFLDDDPEKWNTQPGGVPVLGPLVEARKHGDAFFVNGIGSPHNFWKKKEAGGVFLKPALSESLK